jgi:hypothetical protein
MYGEHDLIDYEDSPYACKYLSYFLEVVHNRRQHMACDEPPSAEFNQSLKVNSAP